MKNNETQVQDLIENAKLDLQKCRARKGRVDQTALDCLSNGVAALKSTVLYTVAQRNAVRALRTELAKLTGEAY